MTFDSNNRAPVQASFYNGSGGKQLKRPPFPGAVIKSKEAQFVVFTITLNSGAFPAVPLLDQKRSSVFSVK